MFSLTANQLQTNAAKLQYHVVHKEKACHAELTVKG